MTVLEAAGYLLAAFLYLILLLLLLMRIKINKYVLFVLFGELSLMMSMTVYPILLDFGVVTPGLEGERYLIKNGTPAVATLLHVLCFVVFGLAGSIIGLRSALACKVYMFANYVDKNIDWKKLAKGMILFALGCWFFYFSVVPVEVALRGAIAARAGDFDDFESEGLDKFVFLKTAASIGFYAAVFVPILMRDRCYIVLSFYIAMVILSYFNSYSRSSVANYFIIPFVIGFLSYNKWSFFKKMGALLPMLFLAYFVFLYTKSFGYVVRSWFMGKEAELTPYQYDGSFIESYFRNVEFIWYSIDAGINYFFEQGSILMPPDILRTPFSVIPYRVLDSIGLGWMSFYSIELKLSCLNTVMFGIDGCTIPPLLSGYSAYFLPFAGGGVLSFLKYFVVAVLLRASEISIASDKNSYWVSVLLLIFFNNLASLIPSAMITVFMLIYLGVVFFSVKSLLLRQKWCS